MGRATTSASWSGSRRIPSPRTSSGAREWTRLDTSRFGVEHARYFLAADPDRADLLRAAVEHRAEFLSQSSGATPHVEEALVVLAAGGLTPGALPDAVRAVRELHESMHRHRMGRLRSLGFGQETAEAISELHTANFM